MNLKNDQSENSRRLWLFPGSFRGFRRKTPGKSQENCWKIFPESRNAINSRILGTGKGNPAGNLGSTLSWTLSPPSVRGVFWNRQFQPSRVFLAYECEKFLIPAPAAMGTAFWTWACEWGGSESAMRARKAGPQSWCLPPDNTLLRKIALSLVRT